MLGKVVAAHGPRPVAKGETHCTHLVKRVAKLSKMQRLTSSKRPALQCLSHSSVCVTFVAERASEVLAGRSMLSKCPLNANDGDEQHANPNKRLLSGSLSNGSTRRAAAEHIALLGKQQGGWVGGLGGLRDACLYKPLGGGWAYGSIVALTG